MVDNNVTHLSYERRVLFIDVSIDNFKATHSCEIQIFSMMLIVLETVLTLSNVSVLLVKSKACC